MSRYFSSLGFFLVAAFFVCCNSSIEKSPSNPEESKNILVKNDSLLSVITCPKCGYKKEEIMPTDVCKLKYTCQKCNEVLFPKEEDCCVYCSYGTKKCPSMQ